MYAYIQLFYRVFFKKIIIDSFSFLFSIMNLKLLLFFSGVIEIVFLEEVTNRNKIKIDIPQSVLLIERQHELTAVELSFENIREDAYRKDYIKYMSQFGKIQNKFNQTYNKFKEVREL